MTAMYHNSGNTIAGVIKFFAEGTVILVQKFIDEVIDFVAIQIRRILSLLEEESRWIFQFFHLIQNTFQNCPDGIPCVAIAFLKNHFLRPVFRL